MQDNSSQAPETHFHLPTLSKQDSAILKGYGILFMIFHHCFGLYFLPKTVDITWIPQELTVFADTFRVCVFLFIFITGYAMGANITHFQTSLYYIKKGLSGYLKFWKLYLFCTLLVILTVWLAPTEALIKQSNMDWIHWLLSLSGIMPAYCDWWYMCLFGLACVVLYPIAAFITNPHKTIRTLVYLLIFSILMHSIGLAIDLAPLRYSPIFILGYTYAFAASHITGTRRGEFYIAIGIIVIQFLLLQLHYNQLDRMLLFAFSLTILPWLTKKLRLTAILSLLGSYSAIMWLCHRFIFGYHFSEALYGTHSYILIFCATLIGSFVLAVLIQWMFNKLIGVLSKLRSFATSLLRTQLDN